MPPVSVTVAPFGANPTAAPASAGEVVVEVALDPLREPHGAAGEGVRGLAPAGVVDGARRPQWQTGRVGPGDDAPLVRRAIDPHGEPGGVQPVDRAPHDLRVGGLVVGPAVL